MSLTRGAVVAAVGLIKIEEEVEAITKAAAINTVAHVKAGVVTKAAATAVAVIAAAVRRSRADRYDLKIRIWHI
jgi:Xaa-Pro aminopeptidase